MARRLLALIAIVVLVSAPSVQAKKCRSSGQCGKCGICFGGVCSVDPVGLCGPCETCDPSTFRCKAAAKLVWPRLSRRAELLPGQLLLPWHGAPVSADGCLP
jgi:hypothetical protein